MSEPREEAKTPPTATPFQQIVQVTADVVLEGLMQAADAVVGAARAGQEVVQVAAISTGSVVVDTTTAAAGCASDAVGESVQIAGEAAGAVAVGAIEAAADVLG